MDIIAVLHVTNQAVEATVCSNAIERSAGEKQHKERKAKACHLPASLGACLATPFGIPKLPSSLESSAGSRVPAMYTRSNSFDSASSTNMPCIFPSTIFM